MRHSHFQESSRAAHISNFDQLTPHQLGDLSERLAAIAFRGQQVAGNATGYDIITPHFGRIEVRARTLGTDREWPRVTLNSFKVTIPEHVLAVRWSVSGALRAAIMLPRAAARTLYELRRQKGKRDQAHVDWVEWQQTRGALDCLVELKTAMPLLPNGRLI